MPDEEGAIAMEWSIASEFGQEKRISAEIARLSEICPFFADRLDDMMTAVTEACLNALEHGNKLDRRQRVRVQVRLSAAKAVYRVLDEGSGFDYEQWDEARLAKTKVSDKLHEENPRGWGLKLMSALADRVRFGREAGNFYTEIEFHHHQ